MTDSGTGPAESAREASSWRDTSFRRGHSARRERPAASAKQRRNDGRTFFAGAREVFDARARLFKLELRRNGVSAGYMAAFAVASALLAVSAWLLLMGAFVGAALSAGLHWALAVVIVLALQSVAVFVLVRAMRALVGNLTFATTRGSWSSAPLKVRNGPIS